MYPFNVDVKETRHAKYRLGSLDDHFFLTGNTRGCLNTINMQVYIL